MEISCGKRRRQSGNAKHKYCTKTRRLRVWSKSARVVTSEYFCYLDSTLQHCSLSLQHYAWTVWELFNSNVLFLLCFNSCSCQISDSISRTLIEGGSRRRTNGRLLHDDLIWLTTYIELFNNTSVICGRIWQLLCLHRPKPDELCWQWSWPWLKMTVKPLQSICFLSSTLPSVRHFRKQKRILSNNWFFSGCLFPSPPFSNTPGSPSAWQHSQCDTSITQEEEESDRPLSLSRSIHRPPIIH